VIRTPAKGGKVVGRRAFNPLPLRKEERALVLKTKRAQSSSLGVVTFLETNETNGGGMNRRGGPG